MPQKKSAAKAAKRAGASKKAPKARTETFVPAAIGAKLVMNPPNFVPAKAGATRIRHKEYVADANKSIEFFIGDTFFVNPGNAELFPWLSTIARSYELYKFHKLKLSYETDMGANNHGVIFLAIDFDASDQTPNNKHDFMSLSGAVRCPVWESVMLDVVRISQERTGRTRYVRRSNTSTIPSTASILDYDLGKLFVASSGAVVAEMAGEVYIEYDVELLTPTAPLPAGENTVIDCTTFPATGYFFGTGCVVRGPISVDVPSATNTLSINSPGTFLILYYIDAIVGAYDIDPTITSSGGVTILWKYDTILSNVTPYRFSYALIVELTEYKSSINVDFSTAITSTASDSSCMIVAVDGAFIPNFELKKSKALEPEDFVLLSKGEMKGSPKPSPPTLQTIRRA